MTTRIAYVSFRALFFIVCFFFLSVQSLAQQDCMETVRKIQAAERFFGLTSSSTEIVEKFTPLINQLTEQYPVLSDTCKYWLASAYQWRSNLGYTKLGFSGDGLSDCLRALSIFGEIGKGDKFQEEKAFLHNTIGQYYQAFFDFDKALFHLKKAVNLFSKLEINKPILQREKDNAIVAIANTYYKIGDKDYCEKYAKEAMVARRAFSKKPEGMFNASYYIANAQYALASAYQLKAENEEKETPVYYQYYDTSFRYLDSCTNNIESSFFSMYGQGNKSILVKLYTSGASWMTDAYPRKIEKANNYLQRAVKYYDSASLESRGVGKIVQSKIRMNQNDLDGALKAVQQSYKYLVVGFDEKDIHINPSLKLSQIRNKVYLLNAINQKATLLKKRYDAQENIKDLEQSYQSFLLSINLIDSLQIGIPYDFSGEAIQSKYSAIYTRALEVAYELLEKSGEAQYLQAAFFIAEKSKSFTLKRSLKKKRLLTYLDASSTEKKLLQKETFLLRKMGVFEKVYLKTLKNDVLLAEQYADSLHFYKNVHYQLQEQIKRDFPKLYSSQFDLDVIDLKDAQLLLDAHTAFVEYVVSPKDLYVFIITNKEETTRLIRISRKQKWATYLDTCLVSLVEKEHNNYQESAKKLYDFLLKEVLVHLKKQKIEHLIIIPDDELRRLPFEVLLEKKPETGQTYKDFSYLLNSYMISYDFSISTSIFSEKKEVDISFENEICGFTADYFNEKGGDINFRRCANTRLRGTENVIDSIDVLFQKSYLNKKTTQKDFLEKCSLGRILYIGVHGCIDKENPLLSNILFTKTRDTINSELSIMEIYNINLKAEHVILTACYAGGGRLKRGEGIISLVRAFYYAGSNSLLTTLWIVEDEISAEIEVGYLKYLKNKGWSKAKALQQAKVDFLKAYDEHPSVWGNFILIGNTSPMQFQN